MESKALCNYPRKSITQVAKRERLPDEALTFPACHGNLRPRPEIFNSFSLSVFVSYHTVAELDKEYYLTQKLFHTSSVTILNCFS